MMPKVSLMDLDAYFDRIGYVASRKPTLRVLNTILRAHVESIPFENLSVLLEQPISLEPDAIYRKFVNEQRGGYCFEHNTLLLHVLSEIGFTVTALSARVRYQRPERYSLPRTHMILRVDLDGQSYLVDGGFGGLSLTAALRLESDIEQPTPHEPRRLVQDGEWQTLALRAPDAVLLHQAYFGGNWHTLYEFSLETMPPVDREMGNWFTSCHPNSHFRSQLMVARATAEGRITLQNRELTHRSRSGKSESRTLRTHDELRQVLTREFGLTLNPDARLVCPGLAELR